MSTDTQAALWQRTTVRAHAGQRPDGRSVAVRIRGSLVRKLRREKGFRTQAELARAVGCSRSSVTMWEASRVLPLPDRLSRLAALLEVSPRQLMEESGRPTLRSLRLAAGLKQADVARALHLRGKGTYSDVERGRQSIPARWIPTLAQLFGQRESTIQRLSAKPLHEVILNE
ncbi:helix-turn-helix domain-containing protein [Streptomyces sp. NPDC059071]|uniref:helix-turn-helix domain-containing protein n=1 Tax=unclassified Streptomyces TaxID=2593676 RepID=UPI0036492196